jgi:hypothetical protein
LRQYTLDAIEEIFYGKEGGFNCLKNNTDHKGWLAMLDAMLAPLSSIGYAPKGAQKLFFMSQLLSSSNRTGRVRSRPSSLIPKPSSKSDETKIAGRKSRKMICSPA